MSALRHPLVPISPQKLFFEGSPSPQLYQTACRKLQLTPIVRTALIKRWTNALTVILTLIATVQQIVMGLQTADTEEGRFAVMSSSLWAGYAEIRVTVSPI